jgi:hypothetical protein
LSTAILPVMIVASAESGSKNTYFDTPAMALRTPMVASAARKVVMAP